MGGGPASHASTLKSLCDSLSVSKEVGRRSRGRRKRGCKLGRCQSSTAFLIPAASWLPPGSLVLTGVFSNLPPPTVLEQSGSANDWLGRSCCNVLSAKNWVRRPGDGSSRRRIFEFTGQALTRQVFGRLSHWSPSVLGIKNIPKSFTNPQQIDVSWDCLTLKTSNVPTMQMGFELLYQAIFFHLFTQLLLSHLCAQSRITPRMLIKRDTCTIHYFETTKTECSHQEATCVAIQNSYKHFSL